MIRRTTWIILIIFILSLGATVLAQRAAKKAAQATPTPSANVLFNFTETSVTKVQIKGKDGKLVAVERDAQSVWQLKEPKVEQTDSAKVSSAISQLVTARILTTLSENLSLEELELKPPSATITVTLKDNAQFVLKVGKLTIIQNGYYAQDDKGRLMAVSKYSLDGVIGFLTNLPVPATPTPTITPTGVITGTLTVTSTLTATPPVTITPTLTATPTLTQTPTSTPAPSPTAAEAGDYPTPTASP